MQRAFIVFEEQKPQLVKYLLQKTTYKSALVFCSKKQSVKTLVRSLKQAGFSVEEMHSDLLQPQREDIINGFTSGRIPILVATDILSRGIDIDTIDLVINYDVPRDGEDYVHRIGRTARAEADGMAFTLVGEREQNSFNAIERLIGKTIEKATLPQIVGHGPEYKPGKQKRNNSNSRKFYKRR